MFVEAKDSDMDLIAPGEQLAARKQGLMEPGQSAVRPFAFS
jgi:hypothetical protein